MARWATRDGRRETRQVLDVLRVVTNDPVGIARQQRCRRTSPDPAQVALSAEHLRRPVGSNAGRAEHDRPRGICRVVQRGVRYEV